MKNLTPDIALLKLDFTNVFNSLNRDKIFLAVMGLAPQLFPIVISAYVSPSSLFFGGRVIESREGVQQGDLLGPVVKGRSSTR